MRIVFGIKDATISVGNHSQTFQALVKRASAVTDNTKTQNNFQNGEQFSFNLFTYELSIKWIFFFEKKSIRTVPEYSFQIGLLKNQNQYGIYGLLLLFIFFSSQPFNSIQFNTFFFGLNSRNSYSCSHLSLPQALMSQNCVNTCHHQCHNNPSM